MPDVARFFSKAVALPPMPEVATKLIHLLGKADVSTSEVASLIERDPALVARVLQLANAAATGRRGKISRLQDAFAMLGVSRLRGLTLAVCISSAFPMTPGFDRRRFWSQNLATAGFARDIADAANLDDELAALCGLLLRTGELLMMMVDPGGLALVESKAGAPGSVFELQQQQYGCTHLDVTAELAVRWRFPVSMVDAICAASDPLGAVPFSGNGCVLRLASVMADAAYDGLDASEVLQGDSLRLAVALGMSAARVNDALRPFATLVQDVDAFL